MFYEKDQSDKVCTALFKILELCKSLGVSISHEDSNGGFIIKEWNQEDADWLLDAKDETSKEAG